MNARYALLQLRVNSGGWPINFNHTIAEFAMISAKEARETEEIERKKIETSRPMTFRYTESRCTFSMVMTILWPIVHNHE